MLISKQDLIDRTRISAQLSDRQVVPFIQDAETYDLPTLLSGNLIAEVKAFDITATEWNSETAYLTGAYVTYNNTYYKALQDIGSAGGITGASATPLSDTDIELAWTVQEGSAGVVPGTDSAFWEPDYKATLRYTHLPDFLIWATYRRMLLQHGRNITEAGITVPNDPEGTYQAASDKSRAELMADATSKADFHRAQINGYMADNGLTNKTQCGPNTYRGNSRVIAI